MNNVNINLPLNVHHVVAVFSGNKWMLQLCVGEFNSQPPSIHCSMYHTLYCPNCTQNIPSSLVTLHFGTSALAYVHDTLLVLSQVVLYYW